MITSNETLTNQVTEAYSSRGYTEPTGETLEVLTNYNYYKERLEYHKVILGGNDRIELEVARDIKGILNKLHSKLQDRHFKLRDNTRSIFNAKHNIGISVYFKVYGGILDIVKTSSVVNGKLRVGDSRLVKHLSSPIVLKKILKEFKDAIYKEANVSIAAIKASGTGEEQLIWDITKHCPAYRFRKMFGDNIDRLLNYPENYRAVTEVSEILDFKIPDDIQEYYNELVSVISSYSLASKEKVVISSNPRDFIECSENTTGWRSCFAIDGEYHASTNSFYRVPNFLVAFVLDSKGAKVGRRWLWVDYDKDILVSGLQYGSFGSIKEVRMEIQKKLAEAKGLEYIASAWKAMGSDAGCCGAAAIYCDEGYMVSYLKAAYPNDEDVERLRNNLSIYDECPDGLDYSGYVDDGYWDKDIECECCGRRLERGSLQYVEDNNTNICHSCADNEYFWCEYHGILEPNYNYEAHSRCSDGLAEDGYVLLDDTEEYVEVYDSYYLEDTGVYVSIDYDVRRNKDGECFSTEYEFDEGEEEEAL